MSKYELKFADGYEVVVIDTFDDMLGRLDAMVQKHGDCVECLEQVSYSRYTGKKCKKIW